MLNCPNCHQSINPKAITCPHCGIVLKAYGHPGIPLYRAETDQFLCEDCTYHLDQSCTFPQYPYAKECTLYNPQKTVEPEAVSPPRHSLCQVLKDWCQKNVFLVSFLMLTVTSVLIALIAQSQ